MSPDLQTSYRNNDNLLKSYNQLSYLFTQSPLQPSSHGSQHLPDLFSHFSPLGHFFPCFPPEQGFAVGVGLDVELGGSVGAALMQSP